MLVPLTVQILDWALVKRLGEWKHEEEAVFNCQRERGNNEKKTYFSYQVRMTGWSSYRSRNLEFVMIDGKILL